MTPARLVCNPCVMDKRPWRIDWRAVFAEHGEKKDAEIGRLVGCSRQAVGHARRARLRRHPGLAVVKAKLEELVALVEGME